MARPLKLNLKTIDKAKKAIELGMTYGLTARYMGITPQTFSGWMNRGREDDANGDETLFSQFFATVMVAEGRGAMLNLARIQKSASDGDVNSAKWIMMNRYGYGRETKITIDADVKTDAKIDLSAMSPEQLAALVADD